jgi:hypothetical protein
MSEIEIATREKEVKIPTFMKPNIKHKIGMTVSIKCFNAIPF